MAKKSKTQRAKASAARAAKKTVTEEQKDVSVQKEQAVEEPKKKLFAKSETAATDKPAKKAEAKPEKKAKKVGFLSEVRSELKRVTWPSRLDVVRWSGVVVVALIFFGVFVFVLDNWVVTPILLFISTIGA